MSYNLLFFIRKSRSEKNTNSLIYLRITINGSRAQMSISRSIPLNKWSSSKGRAKGTNKESKEINDHIDKLTYNLNKIHQNFMDSAQLITPNKMIRALNGIDDRDRKALEVFKEHNENLDQLIGKDISAASAQRYWTCHNHIKQFIKEYYKENDYRLKDIDYTFITKFEHFLKTKRNCNHNSALKYVNNFKKIIRIALANKWMDHDPLINYKVKFEPVEREFLSQEEVDALWSKELHFDRLKLVRDMFVFSCYTGLAYSDVEKLSKSDITLGIDGDRWIRINRTKTGTKSSIPLLPVAEQILERCENHPEVENSERVIPVFSNQKSNIFLKEIAIMCGITKPLTTHLARHTFATTITLTNGVPIETVSKMLGHQSLRTTQHYAKIVDRKISDDMNILKAKLAAQKSKKESKME
ncbi:site-specific integrase [Leeuwenhoekiella polynyae]|uniref:Site-specific recombinase XerD n=1 Tax=Leeuwenhoekiella polynyae TaxID=1550906 RepID=A0A4Q0PHH1_9FLAO|nr:site-specific integrase [Leeuwenhoekiella polynyae]RXG26110.1 site-specific recombinase XerD [Leeuwenhoekiella polynyae]